MKRRTQFSQLSLRLILPADRADRQEGNSQHGQQKVGAGVAVLTPEHLLMVQRRDNGLWDLPGGGVEVGERVEDAALRELYEETGLQLSPADLTLAQVFSGPDSRHEYPDGNVAEWVTVLYIARCSATRPIAAADDAQTVQWWPRSALPREVGSATRSYLAAVQMG